MALGEDAFIKLTPHIGVIKNATNIGVFSTGDGTADKQVWICDSGSDDDAAKHILRIIEKKIPDSRLEAVINTHSHADHCGGNTWFVKHTDCGIWATRGERTTIEVPQLESALIWGGYPIPELRTKFYQAKPSPVARVLSDGEQFLLPGQEKSPLTVKVVPLPGHYINMAGYLVTDTENGGTAFFCGDAIYGRNIIKKYWIPYLYDETSFKRTLSSIGDIKADWYVPSHGDIITTSIHELVELNMIAVLETEDLILDILKEPHTAEEVLKLVADRNSIRLGYGQFVLIGSTIRSYLSCLYETGRVSYQMKDNHMLWMRSE